MEKNVFITVSIPYVNSSPHIGYALELVQADTLNRYYTDHGFNSYFLAGSDENAIKNVEAAQKKGVEPLEFVTARATEFSNLKQTLNLTFDQFIRTSSSKHKEGAQKFWDLCTEDIYKKSYTGLYCVGCEAFYKDNEFEGNICPNHNRKLESATEENYFFRLSKYAKRVKKAIESDEIAIYPAFRKHEFLNFIDQGLEDISISRPTSRSHGWGIPVPGDDTQTMYVWFDALTNYITALDFAHSGELFQKYWVENTNRFHVIGKDIVKFHAVYWPAMLMSANLPIPNKLFVHGFINVEGKKMSKTIGNVVDPIILVDTYGVDAVRYYLLREIPALDDGDFSHKRMRELYNSDLANELGNLAMRLTTLAMQDGLRIDTHPKLSSPDAQLVYDLIEHYQFHLALEHIWEQIKKLNRAIDDFVPWKKTPKEREQFLTSSLGSLYEVGELLTPFLPEVAHKIRASTQGSIKKISPMFPKVNP